MQPDIEEYRKYLDEFDLSEEEKAEFIRTTWSIMENFVDRAFGDDSVQLCMKQKAEEERRKSMTATGTDKSE